MNMSTDTRKQIVDEIPRLRRYARSLCMNPEDADDLVQSCLERALGRISYFRTGTNLRAWLMTIMHNLHVNNLKSSAGKAATIGLNQERGQAADTPAWQHALTIRDLGAAMETLSPEHRAAILLVGMEQYSYREAARIAGISIGTLMSRLHRARQKLAQLMFEENPTGIRRVK